MAAKAKGRGQARDRTRPAAVSDAVFQRVKKAIFKEYAETFRLLAAYDRGEVTLDELHRKYGPP